MDDDDDDDDDENNNNNNNNNNNCLVKQNLQTELRKTLQNFPCSRPWPLSPFLLPTYLPSYVPKPM